MDAVILRNVSKIYRKGFRGIKVPAVTDLSIRVRKGLITGFVGPNGAGKTTTIKMITGLVRPTRGTIELNGKKATRPATREGIAYLSEQPYFYQHLSAEEMLGFTARLAGIPRAAITEEITRVLATVELTGKRRAKVKSLSKGMQQRLNMAQALLGSPHTLVLDEPMSGMDPPGRRLFRELLAQLRDEEKTVFFSTHVLDDIERICDDVIVLDRGQLTFSGEVSALVDKGFSGTEITIPPVQGDLLETLGRTGCTVTRSCSTHFTLFISREDVPSVQLKILADHGIYPSEVTRKTIRLEELLYHHSTGGIL